MVTGDQFKKLFPGNKEPDAWASALNSVMPKYAINNPFRISAFLSQTGHESEEFTALIENLNYSAQALTLTWPKRFPADIAPQYARQPEKIANRAYADRLGNGPEESGDGWKHRGRGAIQVTGKDNYIAFAKAAGKTYEEVFAYLETKEGAVESSCWYWSTRGLNALADKGAFVSITKAINGGTNGINDRLALYQKAQAIFA
jgi:putative chitinase